MASLPVVAAVLACVSFPINSHIENAVASHASTSDALVAVSRIVCPTRPLAKFKHCARVAMENYDKCRVVQNSHPPAEVCENKHKAISHLWCDQDVERVCRSKGEGRGFLCVCPPKE